MDVQRDDDKMRRAGAMLKAEAARVGGDLFRPEEIEVISGP
jgi:hypothetical protein